MIHNPSEYSHQPVMVDEIIELLVTDKDGAYIDLTAGLGGHLQALGKKLNPKARLYGIDKDEEALKRAREKLGNLNQKVELRKSSYGNIDDIIQGIPDTKFDGALLDLGLSSLQLDDPKRGFMFSGDGPLDMRFDQSAQIPTASNLVNELKEKELYEIIRDFGEEKRARPIAAAIVRERQKGMVHTTAQLTHIVKSIVRPPHQNKSLARVFQALRIAVNRELDTLQTALPKILGVLNQGGRLAVLAYHSLEDRIVKNTFRDLAKSCVCPPELPQCVCDKKAQIRIITKRPIYPTESEIKSNPRARSARLRVAEKIA